MTLGKPQRQHRIGRLIEEQAVSSQVQLVELLAAEGVVATQATVSRDLEELGALKVRIPGGATAYAIPAASNASSLTAGNVAIIEGVITPSASGTMQVTHASEVISSAITAKAGSMCQWMRTL